MNLKRDLLVLFGAAVGGLLGYFIFFWIVSQGFLALVVPGGLIGLGGSVVKTSSKAIAALCGLMALALGVFADWRFAPFIADASLGYFITHVYLLPPYTLVMIGAGTGLGFWVPFRRGRGG
jgi:hypothetical protein